MSVAIIALIARHRRTVAAFTSASRAPAASAAIRALTSSAVSNRVSCLRWVGVSLDDTGDTPVPPSSPLPPPIRSTSDVAYLTDGVAPVGRPVTGDRRIGRSGNRAGGIERRVSLTATGAGRLLLVVDSIHPVGASAVERSRPVLGANEWLADMPTVHEVDDARLWALATVAVDAIEARVARGEAADSVVVSVLTEAFAGGTGRDALVTDPAVVGRIVAAVLNIIATDGG